ncbi:DUF2065 domain-containing protein [Palleronia sp.]|uniref:DUF2065 domain-containing protein n=1 Tax=Palleronia sp. TaxID=1940284 RepID=UPI0035C7D532
MGTLLLVLGGVAVLEGLVLALLPHRIEDILNQLRTFPIEARRLAGLIAMVAGVALVALAHSVGV